MRRITSALIFLLGAPLLASCEDPATARRAGLLHDIGKAMTHEVEGPHAIVGGDFIKRHGENATIVNAVASHHEEVPHARHYALYPQQLYPLI